MHRKIKQDRASWSPPPPDHTQPWGGWATHEMHQLRARLHDLQTVLEDVTDEMDRRAMLIDAERKARAPTFLSLVGALASNPVVPYCGALVLLILGTWISGDRQGAISIAKDLLLPKAPGG